MKWGGIKQKEKEVTRGEEDVVQTFVNNISAELVHILHIKWHER